MHLISINTRISQPFRAIGDIDCQCVSVWFYVTILSGFYSRRNRLDRTEKSEGLEQLVPVPADEVRSGVCRVAGQGVSDEH